MTALLEQHSAAANEKQEFSTHSFRSGGAVSRACAGEDVATIMQQAFWKSPQTAWRYMRLAKALSQGTTGHTQRSRTNIQGDQQTSVEGTKQTVGDVRQCTYDGIELFWSRLPTERDSEVWDKMACVRTVHDEITRIHPKIRKDRSREGWQHRRREIFPPFHPILCDKKSCRQDTNGSADKIEKSSKTIPDPRIEDRLTVDEPVALTTSSSMPCFFLEPRKKQEAEMRLRPPTPRAQVIMIMEYDIE